MKNDIAEALFKKLRLNDSLNILILDAPPFFTKLLKDIPHQTKISGKKGQHDFVMVFATTQAKLESIIRSVDGAGKYDCLFWAAYPKGTGSIKSDIKRESVWKAFGIINFETVTQISIDETWTALRGRPTEMVGK